MKWKSGFIPGVGRHGYYLPDRGDVYILRIKHQDLALRKKLGRSKDWILHIPAEKPQTLPTLKQAMAIAEQFLKDSCYG